MLPHQLHTQNIGFSMQTYSHSTNQQQQGLNFRAEVPNPHGITAHPQMSLSQHNQMVFPLAFNNSAQSYNPQTYKSFNNKQTCNWNNVYDWHNVDIRQPVSSETPMSLSSLKHFRGYWTTATLDRRIQVIIPEPTDPDGKHYGVVRSICNDGEALPDQFLYEEYSQFNLCSTPGCVEAIISKGEDVKHSAMWRLTNGLNMSVWIRATKTIFMSAPASRATNFKFCSKIDSPSSCSLSVSKSNSVELLDVTRVNNGNFFQINAVDTNQKKLIGASGRPCRSNSYSKICSLQEKALFELIKAQCNSSPWLKDKVVEWGISHGSKSSKITRENAEKLSEGRLWVTVNSLLYEGGDDEHFQDTLDELKGAYQEWKVGEYRQPEPTGTEEGIQHRLLRVSGDLWVIEKHDFEHSVWCTRAKQKSDGRWIDLKNNRTIDVKLVPLIRILEKLIEGPAAYQDVEHHMSFLYNSCNQKKLNGKLKTKNLKHNIANLKSKLEKQYSLSFAVLVANTADSIA